MKLQSQTYERHSKCSKTNSKKKNSEYGNQIRWLYLHDSIWLPYSEFFCFLEFVLELNTPRILLPFPTLFQALWCMKELKWNISVFWVHFPQIVFEGSFCQPSEGTPYSLKSARHRTYTVNPLCPNRTNSSCIAKISILK